MPQHPAHRGTTSAHRSSDRVDPADRAIWPDRRLQLWSADGMSVSEFDLDSLLAKVEAILKKKKPKPPDPSTTALCEVVASLVVEVARLRVAVKRQQ